MNNLADMSISELKALSQQIRLELTKRLEETQEALHEAMTCSDMYETEWLPQLDTTEREVHTMLS